MGQASTAADELIEFLNDCYLWEDSHEGFEAIGAAYWQINQRVEALQACYPPSLRLPGEGQHRWRELQSAMTAITKTNQYPFFAALDDLLAWLTKQYHEESQPADAPAHGTPDEKTPAPEPITGPLHDPPPTTVPRNRPKRRAARDPAFLLYVLALHHHPPGKEEVHTPISQDALVERLNWPQSSVSRVIKKLFPGGMTEYRQSCANGTIRGFWKRAADGKKDIEAIWDPHNEE